MTDESPIPKDKLTAADIEPMTLSPQLAPKNSLDLKSHLARCAALERVAGMARPVTIGAYVTGD